MRLCLNMVLYSARDCYHTATGSYHIIGQRRQVRKLLTSRREELKAKPGFKALISWDNIPEHGSNMQGMGGDQPLFLTDNDPIMFAGQSIAMVLASDQKSADEIAKYAQENLFECLNKSAPILTIADAVKQGQIFPDCPVSASYLAHIWKSHAPKSDLAWAQSNDKTTILDGHPCAIVDSVQNVGGQLHFNMETQACVAESVDGGTLLVSAAHKVPRLCRAQFQLH